MGHHWHHDPTGRTWTETRKLKPSVWFNGYGHTWSYHVIINVIPISTLKFGHFSPEIWSFEDHQKVHNTPWPQWRHGGRKQLPWLRHVTDTLRARPCRASENAPKIAWCRNDFAGSCSASWTKGNTCEHIKCSPGKDTERKCVTAKQEPSSGGKGSGFEACGSILFPSSLFTETFLG